MDTLKEVNRLAKCGMISRDEYVIKGLSEELDRMCDKAGIKYIELAEAINSLIDNPPKDSNGEPRFVSTSHIRGRVDYNREMNSRKKKDEDYIRVFQATPLAKKIAKVIKAT